MGRPFVTVGIGEILWDLLPGGKQMGGAPVNFAFHCGQLGGKSFPVSCIGHDDLGAEIRETLSAFNLDQIYVFDDDEYPTGTVIVKLDSNGAPTYEICESVAWDHLPMSAALVDLAKKTDAVCFGSLAQRSDLSCGTIRSFLELMHAESLRIFDVNLRQEYFSKDVIESSLNLANVLKLNDMELPVLAKMFGFDGTTVEQLQKLRTIFSLRLIALTRGSQGSLLIAADETSDHQGIPILKNDSVGAGDAFTAALCMGILDEKPLSEINEHANCVGAFVCSQAGATPILPVDLMKCR